MRCARPASASARLPPAARCGNGTTFSGGGTAASAGRSSRNTGGSTRRSGGRCGATRLRQFVDARDIAADAEAAIAAEVAVAVEHRQAGQFDRQAARRCRPAGKATVMPLQVSREAKARATWPSGSRPSAVARSLHGWPSAAAACGPISVLNSSESSVKRLVVVHLPDEAERLAAFARRLQSRLPRLGWPGAARPAC